MPSVTALSVSPTSHIAWLSSDGTVRVWNGDIVSAPITLSNPRLLSFNSHIITSHDDPAHISQFHPTTQRSKKTPVTGVVVALAPHPHTLYASFYQGTITVATFDGEIIASMPLSSAPLTAAFSPDATYLATANTRGSIQVFRPPDCLFTFKAHAAVPSLAWSSSYLASAGWDGAARVWNLTGREIAAFRPSRRKLHAVALSPDGTMLAAAGAAGDVTVWRISEKRILAVHSAHEAAVYALAFTRESRHVASGSADGTIRLFGIPTKPQLVTEPQNQGADGAGLYHVTPVQRIVQGQRSDRRLIFVPSTTVSLTCPVCSAPYNDSGHKPMCSGVCGHTIACSVCNERLWSTDEDPRCPICRATLVDVAYNYELLRILCAARASSDVREDNDIQIHDADEKDVIQLSRLSWVQGLEPFSMNHASVIHKGHLSGEVVAIRIPKRGSSSRHSFLADESSASASLETRRHLSRLRSLRGPHLAQFYGVSRLPTPDNRLLVISELPAGGTLADSLAYLGKEGMSLSNEGILSLSKQIIRTVRFLHESDISAGHALSPSSIALSSTLEDDWDVQRRIKLLELGGTLSRAECTMDTGRSFPSSFVGYMAPELLDEDRDAFRRDLAFKRACRADMYSVGVLVWEIATGKQPFAGMRPAQVVAAVVGRNERPGYPPSYVVPQLQDLITSLWDLDPEKRPPPQQACSVLEAVPSAPPPPT